MKRALIAIGIATVVFGGIFGLAASLGVTSSTLGGGSSAVAACQDGSLFPLNVTFAPSYTTGLPAGYKATTVTVNGLETSCNNKDIKVELSGASNLALGEATDVTGTGTSKSVTISGASAEAVTGVHVTIYG